MCGQRGLRPGGWSVAGRTGRDRAPDLPAGPGLDARGRRGGSTATAGTPN